MINLPSLTEVKQQLYRTTKRFPLPTMCAGILAFLGIYLIHDTYPHTPPDWVWQGLLTAMLGLVGLSALTLAAETTTKLNRGLLMLGGTVLLGLYFWTLPGEENNEGSLWIMRHIFLMLGSFVALAWIPFWKRSASNKILWLWDSQLIGSIVITLFFAIVLFLGLAAALWSIEMLFELDIDEEFYFDIWVLIAALFSPLFFLSQFVPEPAKLKEPKSVSAFMAIFTKYIMTPLSGAYLVILYAYTAKILITWEWPKNVLGWLVIAFLGVAIFTYFLWTPLLKPSFEKYRRIFWLTLIPQIFLLFVAIGWRIKAYSWTENRYFVVVLGLWLLGTTLYFLLRKDAKFKWALVALTAVIFVSQIGPLSGYTIGKTAQTNRLMQLLTENNIKQGDQLIPTTIETNDETEDQIASILDYIRDRFGVDKVKQLFPDLDYTDVRDYDAPSFIMKAYGLDYRPKWERKNEYTSPEYKSFYIDTQKPFDIKGYDWKVPVKVYYSANDRAPLNGYDFRISPSGETPKISIYFEDKLIETLEIADKLEALLDQDSNQENQKIEPEDATIMYESEALAAKIYLTNAWQSGDETPRFEAQMFVRFK